MTDIQCFVAVLKEHATLTFKMNQTPTYYVVIRMLMLLLYSQFTRSNAIECVVIT